MNKQTIICIFLGLITVDAKRLVQLKDDTLEGHEGVSATQSNIEGQELEGEAPECKNCWKKKANKWKGKSDVWDNSGSNKWGKKSWDMKDDGDDCECDFLDGEDICDFEPDVEDCVLDELIPGAPG
jgi:hypothetical protein